MVVEVKYGELSWVPEAKMAQNEFLGGEGGST